MESGFYQRFTNQASKYQMLIVALLVLLGLMLVGWYNYLLFHTLAELFSVIIAFTIFVLTWNGRRFIENGALLMLGISFLFVGAVDIAHTLAFKGMGIFPGEDVNLATHLWLSARLIQAIALVVSPFFLRRHFSPYLALSGFGLLSAVLMFLSFQGVLPVALIDGVGLTPFKVMTEYVIILMYLLGAGLLLRIRESFDNDVIRLLVISVLFNAVAEFFFTQYLTPYDLRNLLGHFFKIVSFYLIYKAIIETGFLKPHDLLFRELTLSEKALRESNARERARSSELEAIMEAVPAVVWIAHDRRADKVTGNLAAAKMVRMAADANLSKSGNTESMGHFDVYQNGKILNPEELPLQVSASSGRPVRDFEMTFIFEDDEERHLFGNVTPLLDEKGQPAGSVGAFVDITERVYTEQALQESERRFRGLFESMAEGFVLVEMIYNEQGQAVNYRYLDANPAFERMTGMLREQITGKTISEIMPGDYLSPWTERFAHAVESGESAQYEDFNEGLNKYFEVLVTPISKRVCAALTIDVTERHLNQEALRISEARLRRLVDSNIIGVIYADQHGGIRLANDAFLNIVGYSREELETGSVNWTQITPPEFLPADEKGIEEANQRGACTPYEKEYIRKDGSRVPVLIGYAHFKEEFSGPPYICFVIDLTEQKRAEENAKEYAAQLERSNRELQDFAFVASHDLQEPLRKIHAFGERLEMRLKDQLDDETRNYLTRMMTAADRMKNMINDLLSLSRVTTRGKPFELVPLKAVAEDVLSDLEIQIERASGKVIVDGLPVVEADATQMRQLLQNLIGNALKFNRPDVPPLVTVQADCSADGRFVQIRVQDNGIGFEEEYQERIFQPFQRLHGAGLYEGSGIGLAICRKIVERHSGTITAQSALGEGSTFIVTLPTRQIHRRE